LGAGKMLKNSNAGTARDPQQIKEVKEAIQDTPFEDINIPLFPLEPNLSENLDCSQLPESCPICDGVDNFDSSGNSGRVF